MDATDVDYMEELTTETFADQSPSPCSPVRNGIYDEPRTFYRIGHEYQAVIPALETDSKCDKACLTSSSSMRNVECDVGVGLSIPIMWIHHEGDVAKVKHKNFSGSIIGATKGVPVNYGTKGYEFDAVLKKQSECRTTISNYHFIQLQSLKCEDECIDSINHCEEPCGCASNERTPLKYKMSNGVPQPLKEVAKGYVPLPGSPASYWNNDKVQSFLLGLYIFGKDLVQVKKFIDCKKIGAILCFYYGKFYNSDAYSRWSGFRKVKGRRCILGHRLFTGWRQQELLSRALPRLSKDLQSTLLEATSALNEGKVSLEEFVSALKKTVGMQILIETIGIGTNNDLTGMSDPVRSHQSFSTRTDVPIGKACSSLSTGDIIKFLTGDFRLSKAKSNDLFWEAVWPRLLARGWHSEQPKDLSVVSKNSLVFLLPGIKKFSRKKLLKGHHYFDSISDVLNKVASDPSLLELEAEGAEGSNKAMDENGHTTGSKLVQNGLHDNQHHIDLRTRVTISNSELMKFTIVDTSMVQGEEPFKVRELRSLPIDAFSNYGRLTHTVDLENDSSEDSDASSSEDQGNSDPDSASNDKKTKERKDSIGEAVDPTSSKNPLTLLCTTLPINGNYSSESCFNQIKEMESQFSCKSDYEKQSYLATMAKRRKLYACTYGQTDRSTCTFPKRYQQMNKGSQPTLSALKKTHKIVTDAEPVHREFYSSLQLNASSDKVDNCVSKEELCSNASTVEATFSNGMLQPRNLIDLNLLPNYSSDYENGEHMDDLACNHHDLNGEDTNSGTKQQPDGSAAMQDVSRVLGDQLPSVNSRRQSTRNRPPTAKALEALAMGLLGTKQTGRDTSAPLSGNTRNRPSRRSCKLVASAAAPTPSAAAPSPSTSSNSSKLGLSNASCATADDRYNDNAEHASTLSEPSIQPNDRRDL